MDADYLARRIDALEASVTEYVLEDIARWPDECRPPPPQRFPN